MSPAARSAVAAALIATVSLSACAPERPPGTGAPTRTTATTRATAKRAKRHRTRRRPLVTVAEVIDGDTIALANGEHVRLVQIDAPEVSQGECYARAATALLERMAPSGTRLRLEADPRLDQVDRYGRLLRYLRRGRRNLNLALVRAGAASVWFFDGDRGRYAGALYAAARGARAAHRGLWGACPGTPLDPSQGVATGVRGTRTARGLVGASGSGCEPGYDPCLPIVADLDCADVRRFGKAPVTVTGSDPYRLDGDHDGIGCE